MPVRNVVVSIHTWSIILLAIVLGACSHIRPHCPGGDCPVEPIEGDISSRVVLVGDAGTTLPGWLDQSVRRRVTEAASIVVFLGDNVYENGFEADTPSKNILRAQVEMARPGRVLKTDEEKCDSNDHLACPGDALFVPGNHDWKSGEEGLRNAKKFLNTEYQNTVSNLPEIGHSGPETLIFRDFTLVALDTEVCLGTYPKKNQCPDDGVVKSCFGSPNKLGAELARNKENHLIQIVVAHHPFISDGQHGGFYDWRSHIFPLTDRWPNLWIPLPVAGSLYPLGRTLWRHPTDLRNRRYQCLISDLKHTFLENSPLVYAAGHDHSLQVHKVNEDRPFLHLVSGSGAKTSTVSDSKTTLFAQLSYGYMVVDKLTTNAVVLRVYSESEIQTEEIVFKSTIAVVDDSGEKCPPNQSRRDRSGRYQCQ